jgi:hypothetical protein
MFKAVEYVGFEGKPELEAQARHATDVLGGVMRDWKDEAVVTWRPGTEPGVALELTLTLALWNATGTATGTVRAGAFDPGEETALRMDVRQVWLDVLGDLSRQQMKRLEQIILEPAEA